MSNSSDSRAVSPVVAMILLVAATGSIWYLDKPFVTFRPQAPAATEPPAPTRLYVQARLWEDPLAAVRKREVAKDDGRVDKSTPKSRRTNFGNVREEVSRALTEKAGTTGQIWFLPVMIPGSNYDLDIETRLRTRYAILAALNKQGFVGENWDDLLYFNVDTSLLNEAASTAQHPKPDSVGGTSDSNAAKGTGVSLQVPYEWFTRGDRDGVGVLLLWLEEHEFRKNSLETVQRLIEQITGIPRGQKSPDRQARLYVRVIGPPWSVTLSTMLEELIEGSVEAPRAWRLEVYSPWATVDKEHLFQSVATLEKACVENSTGGTLIWKKPAGSQCESGPTAGDIVIERTIAEDGTVVRKLVFELHARGVDVCRSGSTILLSEWDTSYGRVFQKTFRKQLKESGLCKDLSDLPETPRVVYLSGLDGRLPGDADEAKQSQKSPKNDREASPEDIERPDGRSQVDYLRRLANRLVDQHSKTLQAVGILGTDVFDKLLVLEALRDRLPHVVFFTTDLDARFLHPSQRRWTRNLIVASSFGLDYPEQLPASGGSKATAGKDLVRKEELPPFRDNYQTAMYAACLRALACGNLADAQCTAEERSTDKANLEDLSTELGQPKVYEIGRTRLFRLDTDFGQGETVLFRPVDCAALLLLAGVMLAGALATKRFRGLYPLAGPQMPWWMHWHWFSVLSLATALCGIQMFLGSVQRVQEPFAWFEGVSIWPSALLRSATAILAATFLAWLPAKIERVDEEVGRIFKFPAESSAAHRCKSPGWRRWLPLVRVPNEPLPEGKSLLALWAAYRASGSWSERRRRLLASSFTYFAVWLLIVWCSIALDRFEKPHTPYRGDGSLWASSIPLFVCLLFQVLLTFFVVDATCLSRSLVRQVATGRNHWPQQAADRWGLPEDVADEALAVDLIARQTKLAGQMILFPFTTLLLLIVSRNFYFDRWDWPVFLLLVYGANSLIAFFCAFILWRSGESSRRWALQGLQDKLLQEETKKEGGRAVQLKQLIEQVRSIRDGVFAPVTQHPLFAALFLPFGGVGIASLLDFLSNVL